MERRSSFAAREAVVSTPSSPSRPPSTRNLLPILPPAIRAPISSVSLDPSSVNSTPRGESNSNNNTPRVSSMDLRNNFSGALSTPTSQHHHQQQQPPSSPSGRLFEQPAVPPTTAFTKKFPELLMAIRIGHVSRCALLLEKSPGSANAIDGDGTPALMRASMLGHADIVTLLIHKGAYTERRDPKGYTSLLHACERGKAKAVKALLDGGANPRVNTRQLLGHKFEILDDDTPMGLATEYGHTDVITVLQNFSMEEERREKEREKEAKARKRKGLNYDDEPIKTKAEIEKENKKKEDEAIAASNPEIVRMKDSSESSSSRSLGLDDALNIAEEAEAAIRAAGGDGDIISSTPSSLSYRRRHSMAAFTVAASMLGSDDASSEKKKDEEKNRRASMSETGLDRQRRHSMAEMRGDNGFDFDDTDDNEAWGGLRGSRRSWGEYIRTSLRIVTTNKKAENGGSKGNKQVINKGSEMNAISSPLMEAASKRGNDEGQDGFGNEMNNSSLSTSNSKRWCSIV